MFTGSMYHKLYAGFYTKLNVWGSLGLNFEYDGGPFIEIGVPSFYISFEFRKVVHPSVKARCCPRSVILRAMFGPLPIFWGAI